MADHLLGRGIIDHEPALSTHRQRMRRRVMRALVTIAMGVGATVAIFVALGLVRHIEETMNARAESAQRARFERQLAELQARVVDGESWQCTEIKPEHRLTPRQYRWCQRERGER